MEDFPLPGGLRDVRPDCLDQIKAVLGTVGDARPGSQRLGRALHPQQLGKVVRALVHWLGRKGGVALTGEADHGVDAGIEDRPVRITNGIRPAHQHISAGQPHSAARLGTVSEGPQPRRQHRHIRATGGADGGPHDTVEAPVHERVFADDAHIVGHPRPPPGRPNRVAFPHPDVMSGVRQVLRYFLPKPAKFRSDQHMKNFHLGPVPASTAAARRGPAKFTPRAFQ
ncbi:hypothetical protein [Streptomyces althioticus]|uniref:hypothetical protein n=1 Tax=Streptomyces althioticus TaxID=83380 RepID=UPI00331CB533